MKANTEISNMVNWWKIKYTNGQNNALYRFQQVSRKIAAQAVRANGKNHAEPLPHKVSPVLSTRETGTHFNL